MSSLGHPPEDIGLLIALALAIKLFGPPIWGPLADRGSRRLVLIGTSFAAWISSWLFFLSDTLSILIIGALLYSFFQNAQLSLVEATTLETVDRYAGDYGKIRLWGSWGFIVLAFGLGLATDIWGLSLVPWVLTLLLMGSAFISLTLPEAESKPAKNAKNNLFSKPSVRWFYATCLLMQFSHGTYYGFMSIHLANYGFSRTAIGMLWALGVISEVFLMSHSKNLLSYFGVSRVISLSLFLALVRWSLYATPPWWPFLILGQILHAFTFGSFHIASVRRTFEMAPLASRATAQAWYSALSFGLGGGVSLLLSGYLYEKVGAELLFVLMAFMASLGLLTANRATALFLQEKKHA